MARAHLASIVRRPRPSTITRRMVLACTVVSMCIGGPKASAAQDPVGAWAFHARAMVSGSSYDSSPAGYTLYSGVAIEVGVRRVFVRRFAVELSLRSESREASGPPDASVAIGSLEVLPISLLAQWHPRATAGVMFRPYLGAGVTLTTVWEKSGALDSVDVGPHIDPTVQGGADLTLNARLALNLDARWQTLRLRIDDYAVPAPDLEIDPLVLGLGLRISL